MLIRLNKNEVLLLLTCIDTKLENTEDMMERKVISKDSAETYIKELKTLRETLVNGMKQ